MKDRNKGNYTENFISNYTVVDIETTGLSPATCEIIELSAIKVRDDRAVDTFSSLIKPTGKLNYYISKLTGITDEMLVSAPNIKEVLPKFMEFVGTDLVMGHNVNFDINFIYDNWERHFQKEFTNDFVDTMKMSRKYCKLPSHKLDALAAHYNVAAKGHHRALTDCEITLNVYKKIKKEVCEREKELSI